MTTQKLNPQYFFPGAVTQLPDINLFEYAKNQLPQVYQNAPNFMATVSAISNQKQYLYDVIRSLVNVYNLNNTNGTDTPNAIPFGIYLQMLAAVFNAPYTQGAASSTILNSIQNTVVFVNSRGYPSDFYNYFALNGLQGYFTNANVQEDGNATIFFNVPIENTPLDPPNPLSVFQTNTFKLKGAGIEIIISGANVPFFQMGSLPTDTPPYQVAPGNAGFGVLTPDGEVINGGYYQSL